MLEPVGHQSSLQPWRLPWPTLVPVNKPSASYSDLDEKLFLQLKKKLHMKEKQLTMSFNFNLSACHLMIG